MYQEKAQSSIIDMWEKKNNVWVEFTEIASDYVLTMGAITFFFENRSWKNFENKKDGKISNISIGRKSFEL